MWGNIVSATEFAMSGIVTNRVSECGQCRQFEGSIGSVAYKATTGASEDLNTLFKQLHSSLLNCGGGILSISQF